VPEVVNRAPLRQFDVPKVRKRRQTLGVVPGGSPSSEGQLGLAKAVRELREKAGLSQAALSERADLPEAAIALIESASQDPAWGDIRRIAQALGVSLEALSELAEQHEPEREV